MTKKIFAISTLLLVLVAGAIFVYNFVFKKPSQKQEAEPAKTSEEGKVGQPTGTGKDSGAKKESGEPTVKAVSDEPVFGATLSPDGNYLYIFLGSNGQLNQTDLSGKLEKVISTESFSNLRKVLWNKPENKVIVKTEPELGKTEFFYFDLAGKKVMPLKENIDSVAWSSLGDKIIYKYYEPKTKKRTVSVADPDGKNWRNLSEFNYQSVEISPIPNSSLISFWPSPNAFTAVSLNTIAFSGENRKEILKDRYGADILWSPDGKNAAVSSSDQKGGHKIDLYLMNSLGGQFQFLLFPTFASKCAWSADAKNLFCAMPGNIPESATLPNDWLEGKITTSDTFWKIDIESGKKERLVDPEKISGSFDALNLFLSQDEKTLFFISKSDGKLYRLGF